MTTTKAKRFEYTIGLDESGTITAEGGDPITPAESWTPEHLLLAALARCTMASLQFSAGRAGATVGGGATASGAVTRREEDGRFALVEANVAMNVTLDPEPEDLAKTLHFAEKGCFVGASLVAKPVYSWTVNGREVTAGAG